MSGRGLSGSGTTRNVREVGERAKVVKGCECEENYIMAEL